MKSLPWLFTAVLLSGCATKPAPMFEDGGVFPTGNPYDHRQNPQYTTGAMAGFRSLYVDPKSYPGSLTPVEPPPAPPIQMDGPNLPDGLFPAIMIQADLEQLNEGSSFESLVSTIEALRDGIVVNMPSQGLILFPAPEREALQARTMRRLKSTKWSNKDLGSITTISVGTTLPKAALNSMIKEQPDGSEGFSMTLVPRPATPTAPATGQLVLENTSTAWAEVEINDAKVGVLGPLAEGTVAQVRSGMYKITFTLPNGYTWSEKKMTSAAH